MYPYENIKVDYKGQLSKIVKNVLTKIILFNDVNKFLLYRISVTLNACYI